MKIESGKLNTRHNYPQVSGGRLNQTLIYTELGGNLKMHCENILLEKEIDGSTL